MKVIHKALHFSSLSHPSWQSLPLRYTGAHYDSSILLLFSPGRKIWGFYFLESHIQHSGKCLHGVHYAKEIGAYLPIGYNHSQNVFNGNIAYIIKDPEGNEGWVGVEIELNQHWINLNSTQFRPPLPAEDRMMSVIETCRHVKLRIIIFTVLLL